MVEARNFIVSKQTNHHLGHTPSLLSYDQEFFAKQAESSARAAEIILALVLGTFKPKSVVDVGCGAGGWLKAAAGAGVSDVLGLEGGSGVSDALLVPSKLIHRCDFEAELPEFERRFDLAICLEVVEHLSPEAGARVVKWLCSHAPVVLFSAALPGQNAATHINLQWLSEWANQFGACGYTGHDIIRPEIWNDARIPYWYRQNAVVFVEQRFCRDHILDRPDSVRDLVHPELLTKKVTMLEKAEKKLARLEKKLAEKSSLAVGKTVVGSRQQFERNRKRRSLRAFLQQLRGRLGSSKSK